EFVQKHHQHLRQLFRDVLQVLKKAGLVKLECVGFDGTKVEADAGKGSVHSQSSIAEELAAVDAQLSALEKEWAENEAGESRLLSADWAPASNASVPQRLARARKEQERLQEALAAIERRQGESSGPAPKPIASVSDPSSRVMPDKEGKSKP